MRGSVVLAVGYWLWSAVVALIAGFVGAGLNCEGGEGCKPGFPSWVEPWTWGDHYVYPETLYVGLPGLGSASLFVALVMHRRAAPAAAAFVISLALLGYPFFGGLTPDGRAMLSFGPLLGAAPLVNLFRQRAGRNERGSTGSLRG